jgi:hypothetical protein
MAKKTRTDIIRLRAEIRQILIDEGTPLGPTAEHAARLDDLIANVVASTHPELDSAGTALQSRIADRSLSVGVSDHCGALMTAYGDAGYFVGLCAGLELAALTTTPTLTIASAVGSKAGAR